MTYLSKIQIYDAQEEHSAAVDEFHSLRVNSTIRLVGASFIGSIKDTNFWTEASANGGTVTQGGGYVILNTNTTADATIQYQTIRTARWVPGHENVFRTIMRVGDTGTANNVRNWGAFNSVDGLLFQLNGTSLRIVTRNNSVDSSVNDSSWNRNSTFVLDTNYHIYEINMTYADIDFYIDGILVHKLETAGEFGVGGSAVLPCQSLNLPVTFQNNNIGGSTSNVNMSVAVGFISRQGPIETEAIYKHISTNTTTICKYNSGKIHRIVINSPGAGGNIATIYDNTAGSGTVIGIIDTTGASGFNMEFLCPFFTGLTIVTATGTPGDLTIIYE